MNKNVFAMAILASFVLLENIGAATRAAAATASTTTPTTVIRAAPTATPLPPAAIRAAASTATPPPAAAATGGTPAPSKPAATGATGETLASTPGPAAATGATGGTPAPSKPAATGAITALAVPGTLKVQTASTTVAPAQAEEKPRKTSSSSNHVTFNLDKTENILVAENNASTNANTIDNSMSTLLIDETKDLQT